MEPRVEVELDAATKGAQPNHWAMAWNICNAASVPLQIVSARLPHGRFRSDETTFEPPLDILPGQSRRIEIEARCGEAPGAEIENAFIIMRVVYDRAPWLILARLRVGVDSRGMPGTITESITAQPVGFADRQTA
jgi:hypothetical protein